MADITFDRNQLAEETLRDLFRSAWLIERARSVLYRRWAEHESNYEAAAEACESRAGIVARSLDDHGGSPDEHLVDGHATWLGSVVGWHPEEVPLAPLFVARLGDWVLGHAGPLVADASRLEELGDREKANLSFPSSLPEPPPFEPLEPVVAEPPGERRFTFAILGDLHFGSPFGESMAKAAIADINASDAELVIQLGDLTDHGNRSEFELAVQTLGLLKPPVTTMLGNHDIYSMEETRLSGREYYPLSFGREPDGVLLEHKGVRFAVLDSATSGASPFAPFDFVSGSFVDAQGGALVHGSLTPPQHDLLAEVAAPGAPPAFVFLHHPPQPFTGFPPILFGLREADSGRLHATCDSGNVWGVFAGHTHRNRRTRDFDGVPAHEVAIPRDYPFGYALVDVTETGYAFRFLQISDEALLREAYPRATAIHRRYGRGADAERAFVWTRPVT